MKMKRLALATITMAAALGMSKVALSEAGLSYESDGVTKPQPVTADVNFRITVPKIMILRVGDWGATENEVAWIYKFGLAGTDTQNGDGLEDHWNKTGSLSNQDANTDTDAADTTDGTLKVMAFANLGTDVTLKATSTDFVSTTGATGNQPHLSEIVVDGASNIGHPVLEDSGDSAAVTLTATDGVVRLTDDWKYTYKPDPSKPPVAGIYTANVKYTMAAP